MLGIGDQIHGLTQASTLALKHITRLLVAYFLLKKTNEEKRKRKEKEQGNLVFGIPFGKQKSQGHL